MTYQLTQSSIEQFQSALMESDIKLNTAKKYVRDVKKLALFYLLRKNLFRRIRWMRSFGLFRKRDMAPAASIRSLPVLNPIANMRGLQICNAKV